MAHWIKYEEEFIPNQCLDLLEYFNLLTGEQAVEQLKNNTSIYSIDNSLMLDGETLQVLSEEDEILTEISPETIIYKDIDVIVVSEEYFMTAYKIGETIDDCLFLGDSLYINYIHKIIKHYLETGEYGFHLS